MAGSIYDIAHVDQMEGHEFERFIAGLLGKSGYQKVEVTPGSGDQGVDVLAEKDGVRYAFQCKCYSSDLGNTPVQEVNTGKMVYHCHVGVVVTNRYFTQGAKDAAQATGVLLWDRSKLQELVNRVVSGGEHAFEPKSETSKIHRTKILSLANRRKKVALAQRLIGCINGNIVGIQADGTIAATWKGPINQFDVSGWQDIVEVLCTRGCIVGLKSDGTVVATGSNEDGQCEVQNWENIVTLFDGGTLGGGPIGQRKDGSLVVTRATPYSDPYSFTTSWGALGVTLIKNQGGLLRSGNVIHLSHANLLKPNSLKCSVCESYKSLRNIVDFSGFKGLRADGTVVTAKRGILDAAPYAAVERWTDIVGLSDWSDLIVGLRLDGTVLLAGECSCKFGRDVSHWSKIVAIDRYADSIIGLREDGTVVVAGNSIKKSVKDQVSQWKLFDDINTLMQNRADVIFREKEAAKKAEAERQRQEAEECQRKAAEEAETERRRLQKIAALKDERAMLQVEHASLKGLFTHKRRREIEAKLEEIDQEIPV